MRVPATTPASEASRRDANWRVRRATAIRPTNCPATRNQEAPPPCATFVTSMFPEGADPDLVTAVNDDMCNGPAEIGSALMHNFADYDIAEAMQSAGVPIRAVNSTLWPTDPEVNRKYADFEAVLMEDVGHFLMQEAPEEFNLHLRAVISDLETD